MDDFSYKLLKVFSEIDCASATSLSQILKLDCTDVARIINNFYDNGWLKIDSVQADGFVTITTDMKITIDGKAALELERKKRHNFGFTEFRAWFTLAIALAAFIKSFFF